MKLLLFVLVLTVAFSFIKVYQNNIFLNELEGKKIFLSGKVTSEPTIYDNSQSIKVQGIYVYLPRYPMIGYGDKVHVEGVYKEGRLNNATVKSHQKARGALYKFRDKLISFYKKALPEPHASLVAGVVIGSKKGMPNEFWEDLQITGTLHVVVASGMNVTLVAGFLMEALVQVINRKRAVIIAICGIWLYALLSGFDAPIVRASVMGSIAFSAQKLGRVYDAWRGLIISIIIMLFLKPLYISDMGFQLSVLATASLMKFEPLLNRLLHFVPGVFRADLSTSLAAQIGVAPLLFVTFGQFNLISPFINALILWTIPIVTITGMLAGIVSLLSYQLAHFILTLVYPLTLIFVKVVQGFSY